jgi:hypothetical protein
MYTHTPVGLGRELGQVINVRVANRIARGLDLILGLCSSKGLFKVYLGFSLGFSLRFSLGFNRIARGLDLILGLVILATH